MMRRLPSSETLDRLDHAWPVDPTADLLIDRIFEAHSVEAVSHVLHTCSAYDDVTSLTAGTCDLPPALLDQVHAYFDDARAVELPAWADEAKMADASSVFLDHEFTTCLILASASLPECYVSGDIARILSATHQLDDKVHRRIVETLRFLTIVLAPGSLTSGDREGLLTIHKVRLMHAAIRHLIRARREANLAATRHHLSERLLAGHHSDKSPINQCVMAFTLQTFSYVIVRGLTRLGVEMTPQQQNDYIHTWSVIGHFLGIDDGLLPRDVDQARELFELLKNRQSAETEHGKALQQSLLRFCAGILPWYVRSLHRQATYDLIASEDCVRLGMDQPGPFLKLWNVLPLMAARLLNRRHRTRAYDLAGIPHDCEYIARHLVSRAADLPPDQQLRGFVLPDRLRTWR